MSGNFEVMPIGTAARLAQLEAENERLRALLHHVRGCLNPFVWGDECAEINAALKEGQR